MIDTMPSVAWNERLIKRYNLTGPRYTSYPTAPQFSDGFPDSEYAAALERSNDKGGPLSLYFHIPFCDTVCYYCACNKIVTNNKQRSVPYLDRLKEEMELKSALLAPDRIVRQLHWGGGTPTFLSSEQMRMLMSLTRDSFNLLDDDSGEYSIEIHPGDMTESKISDMRDMGFNRISMGVQDFHADTQKAVNRFNSEAEIERLMEKIGNEEFHSVSMDLIYGLPFQTERSFEKTLEKIIRLSPDRLSLFSYAHLPHVFKTQRQIDEESLPSANVKLSILQMSIEMLTNAGYLYIGMDHFAKPGDGLAIAQAQGELQRNFQGYSTNAHCDLLGFGVSAISTIDNIYVQNHKTLTEYNEAIDTQQLPFRGGISLSQDDQIRQHIINSIICQFELEFADVERRFDIDFYDYFQSELNALHSLEEDSIISIASGRLTVLDQGRLLVRKVCMMFDAYLTRQPEIRYSQII